LAARQQDAALAAARRDVGEHQRRAEWLAAENRALRYAMHAAGLEAPPPPAPQLSGIAATARAFAG
jgi:hypothetical protein